MSHRMVSLLLSIVLPLDMKITKSCMMSYDDVRSTIVFFLSVLCGKSGKYFDNIHPPPPQLAAHDPLMLQTLIRIHAI